MAKKVQPQKFVDIQGRSHIDNILKRIFKMASKLQIWQKDETLRLKTDGKLVSLNLSSSTIELEADGVDGFINFDKNEIYFYSPLRTTIFKSKIKKKDGGRIIVIEYPEIVKVEEARMAERKNHGLRSYQSLDLMAVSSDGKKIVLSDLRLVDTSKDGAAFLIGKIAGEFLEKGTKIVTLKCSVEGIEQRGGIIRNVSPFKNNLSGESCYRVGVEFITEALGKDSEDE